MGSGGRQPFLCAVFLLLCCLLLPTPSTFSADPDVEYKLKSEMLERFTRFIEWPAVSGSTFLIGVVGEDPFGQRLQQVFHETRVNAKAVEIRSVSSLEGLDAYQMLFISRTEKARLPAILQAVNGRPVLTVADTDGFAQLGVIINFYQSGEYIRFEVNQPAADASGLKFSSRLLKLARIVETTGK